MYQVSLIQQIYSLTYQQEYIRFKEKYDLKYLQYRTIHKKPMFEFLNNFGVNDE